MKTAVVLTTINAREKTAIPDYEAKCREAGYDLVVVGDRKTPDMKLEHGTYLSAKDQEGLPYGRSLPWNDYCRKNVGYIFAIKERGAECIISTDDDNYPLDNWIGMNRWFNCGKVPVMRASGDHAYINIFKHFNVQNSERIWPRGVPLYAVDSGEVVDSDVIPNVKVVAGLWDGSPDFDAIGHAYYDHIDWRFREHTAVVKCRGCLSPYNTQNTAFTKDVAIYQFLCPRIARAVDIWTGYIAAFVMESLNQDILYVSSTVEQRRNEHDCRKDLMDERKVFLETDALIESMSNVDYQDVGHEQKHGHDYFYDLCDGVKHLMPPEFMKWVDEWMDDFAKA